MAEGLADICSGGKRRRLGGITDNSVSLLGDDTVFPLARTSGDNSFDDGSDYGISSGVVVGWALGLAVVWIGGRRLSRHRMMASFQSSPVVSGRSTG